MLEKLKIKLFKRSIEDYEINKNVTNLLKDKNQEIVLVIYELIKM